MKTMVITSEQVGKGHPDKICDQVSDLILTKILQNDKDCRVAVETAIGKHILFITGEISTIWKYTFELLELEINKLLLSIDTRYKTYKIIWDVSMQSPEISKKVNQDDLGAGDQGLMFGYATKETKEMLPIPYVLATRIIKKYEKEFATNVGEYFFDSKSQVSYDYSQKRIININLSVQHSENKTLEVLRVEMNKMIMDVVKEFEVENGITIYDDKTIVIINNAGTFILGGSFADAGLTGRKIISDTYGGLGRHGGGAFSGKDYTKVDRSAAYYARYVAKMIIKEGLAEIIEIQVAYIIGISEPVSIGVDSFETGDEETIKKFIDGNFNFSLSNIISELNLKEVDYTKTSIHGHFGKNYLPWE